MISTTKIIALFILSFSLFHKYSHSIQWLGLANLARDKNLEMQPFSRLECRDAKRLNVLRKRRHHKFCLHDKFRFAMHGIMVASQAATFYCMKAFKNRRWNCETVKKLPRLNPDLKLGTKEQAIVHAFSSVALVFEIARRCSKSKLQHCPCGNDRNNPAQTLIDTNNGNKSKFYRNNCPDNIEMGEIYARRFLGYHRMGRPRRKKQNSNNRGTISKKLFRRKTIKRLNGHNYEVGLRIIKDSWKLKCKCHGVSGSCSHEVCYRQLRRLDDDVLLQKLKDHYFKAKYVTMDKDGQLYPSYHGKAPFYPRPLGPMTLGFIEHSPDYCESNFAMGSTGTQGRECKTINATLSDTIHCSNLCCGRGYREFNKTETVRCNCRFVETFVVKCDYCRQTKINKICI